MADLRNSQSVPVVQEVGTQPFEGPKLIFLLQLSEMIGNSTFLEVAELINNTVLTETASRDVVQYASDRLGGIG
jgi:hypothetical protein